MCCDARHGFFCGAMLSTAALPGPDEIAACRHSEICFRKPGPPDITARRLLIVDYPWRLTAANFILPIFVHEECGSAPTLHLNGTVGSKCSEGTEDIPISSMPDVSRVGVRTPENRGGAGLGNFSQKQQ